MDLLKKIFISLILSFFLLNISVLAKEYSNVNDIISLLKSQVQNIIIDNNMKIEYLGKIDKLNIYYYSQEFGNKRLTQRLVFINNKNNLSGLYAIPERPTIIKENKIIFSFPEKDGNSIEINNNILPNSIYLDAELYSKMKK